MVSITLSWLQMLVLLIVGLLVAGFLYRLGSSKPYSSAVLVLVVALLIGFVYMVRSVIPPFLIAFVIAWLFDPLMTRLHRRGMPRVIAVASVFLVFLGLFAVGVIFLVPAVIEQSRQFAVDFPGYLHSLTTFVGNQMNKHRSMLIEFKLPTTIQEALVQYGDQVQTAAESAIVRFSNLVISAVSRVIWFIVVPLVAFYMLIDMERIRCKVALLIPANHRKKTVEVLTRLGGVFTSYVRGLLTVCLLYGIATAAVLMLLGLKYGIILGLVAGVLYAVPYIGAISTALLVFLVGLATYDPALSKAAITAGSMVALNQFFDLLISPRILGQSVGLHPVISLFALFAGGELWGLWGMVLAVPIAACVQEIVFEFHPELARRPSEPGVKKKKRTGILVRIRGKDR